MCVVEGQSNDGGVTPVKSESLGSVQASRPAFKLREVKRLVNLVRAYTLLAVMVDRTSPQYQLNLLRAYTFVLQIWKVKGTQNTMATSLVQKTFECIQFMKKSSFVLTGVCGSGA